MRFLHENRERVIIQLHGGTRLEGAIIKLFDWGMEITNLSSKGTKKVIEWNDMMLINDALAGYTPEKGVHDLGFVLELCKAVGEIYE